MSDKSCCPAGLSGLPPIRGGLSFMLAAGVLALSACSSTPPPPDWQLNAQGASERALEAQLSGVTAVADSEWARARAELARTGRPELLARLELLRCAAEVASLVFSGCPAYAALAADAPAAEQAYARYLAGQASPADAEQLPLAQRPLLAAAASADTLRALPDPLSRLVGAGVLLQRGQADAAVLTVAVDAASAQGWRRPLLAWLGAQRQRAEAAGNAPEQARLQRRIDLVLAAPASARPAPAASASRP